MVGEIAVVGQDQQSLRIEIETADRIDIARESARDGEIDDGRTPLRIGSRAHDAARLVDEQVPAFGRRALQPAPVHLNLVLRRIRLAPECVNDPSVDFHSALPDQLISRTPRRDTGRGENLV